MSNYLFTAHDTCGNTFTFDQSKTDRGILLTLKKEKLKGMYNIHALGEFTRTSTGEEGFYLIPRNRNQSGDIVTRFDKREDMTFQQGQLLMSFFGFRNKDVCCLCRAERSYRLRFDVEVIGGVYSLSAVFEIERDCPDPETGLPAEDIRIEVIFLDENTSWCDMARLEREIRLERKEIVTLAKKCQREAVEYARKYPLIRIRNGWKPSPTPVLHQTLETEPPMHVACTFRRVRELAEECKAQGVEGAEFQLVGWNLRGHDGRWPQAFPVEEALGGEEELRKTAEHLKSLGYRISLHDNIMDAYEIAENFSPDDLTKTKSGGFDSWGDWSGGCSYNICPTVQRRNAQDRAPKMAALGVNGIHYSDVLSIVEPSSCFDKKHPLPFHKALDITKKNMEYMGSVFGAFSSEGAMDFSNNYIDYVLYATFGSTYGTKLPDICSESVNAFEVAYHGTVLYNPMSTTINYPIKHPVERLNLIMRGGKPSIYFYSKFCTGTKVNWMGEDDFTCDGEEDMKKCVSLIRSALEDHKRLCHLQLEFMDSYDVLGDGLEMATYSDGTRLVGNFSDTAKKYEDKEIEPYGYAILN